MSYLLMRNLERVLSAKSLPVVLAVLGVVLTVPSVWTGWQQDDLVQRYFLLGNPDVTGVHQHPLDLFRFLDGDSTRSKVLMDKGVVPWWTLPTLRISFWRPLSALSHSLDYLLWPQSAALMHVQNLLWFAALIIAAAMLYRRIIGGGWVAGLAALLFALDDVHGLAAGWLASRNALIAGFFGILVLLIHHRWRSESWKPGAVLGPIFLALALLAGESALAVCGYLFAYALFMESGVWQTRLATILPSAVVAGGWLIFYSILGYGTSGSGFYVDPISEPAKFLGALAWKAPLLLADQWALPPSSIVMFLSDQALWILLVWALLILAVIATLLIPILRRDRTARFWCTGMVLSIPVVCSTMPHSRLLTFAGVGAFGLLAQWMGGAWGGAGASRRSSRVLTRAMVLFFVVTHVFVAAMLLAANATSAVFGKRYIQDPAAGISAGPEFQNQDFVILNPPVAFYAHHFHTARLLAGQTVPRRVRVLAPGTVPLHIQRTDERTLVVRPEGGFLAFPFDNVFRGSDHPLGKGELVRLEGMTVEILETAEDGRPAVAAFQFPRRLEDESLRWVRWEGKGYAPFMLPRVGETITIEAGPSLF